MALKSGIYYANIILRGGWKINAKEKNEKLRFRGKFKGDKER